MCSNDSDVDVGHTEFETLTAENQAGSCTPTRGSIHNVGLGTKMRSRRNESLNLGVQWPDGVLSGARGISPIISHVFLTIRINRFPRTPENGSRQSGEPGETDLL